jgi:hypothetical protein
VWDMHVAKHGERREVAIKRLQRRDRNLDVNDRFVARPTTEVDP